MEVCHFLPPKLMQDQNPSLQNQKPVKPEVEILQLNVKCDFSSEEFQLLLPDLVLLPLPVLPVSGSGVTDSDPASVLVAGNDELPYKFCVHEYLKKNDK